MKQVVFGLLLCYFELSWSISSVYTRGWGRWSIEFPECQRYSEIRRFKKNNRFWQIPKFLFQSSGATQTKSGEDSVRWKHYRLMKTVGKITAHLIRSYELRLPRMFFYYMLRKKYYYYSSHQGAAVVLSYYYECTEKLKRCQKHRKEFCSGGTS